MQHVWIFQLESTLSPAQRAAISTPLNALVASWKSHGADVPGTYDILHDRFLVVQAEPGTTSGCSIDSMNHGVDKVLADNGLAVLPHNFIFYRDASGSLEHIDFREVKAAISAGKMGPDTLIFDSSLGQSNDLAKWEVRLGDSWLSRFLPARQGA